MAYLILISLFLWIPKTLPFQVKGNDPYTKEWVLFQGVHYQISPEILTWSQADEFCKKIGGDLLQNLSRNSRMFLEKTSKEMGKMSQTWWVGQDLFGRFEESPELSSIGTQLKNRSEMKKWGPGDAMVCTHIIMDPAFELVTTSTCTLKRSAICTLGFNKTSIDVAETSQSEMSPIEAPHKISKRYVMPYRQDPNLVLQRMKAVQSNGAAVLAMALEIIDMEETAKVHLILQHKTQYLKVLMDAAKIMDPENVNSSAILQRMIQCAATIGTIVPCEVEDPAQTAELTALIVELHEVIGMQLLKAGGEQTIIIEHPMETVYLSSVLTRKMDNFLLGTQDDTHCQLPSLTVIEPYLKGLPKVNVQMFSFVMNPLQSKSDDDITNKVCSLSVKDDDGQEIKIHNLSHPVEIFMPRQQPLVIQYTNLTINKGSVVTTNLSLSNLTEKHSSVVFKMHPSENVTFQILLAFDRMPNITDFDHSLILTNTTGYHWVATPEMLVASGGNWSAQISLLNYTGGNAAIDLRLLMFEAKCIFWDNDNQTWSTNGCQVGVDSEPNMTQCLCNHLTFFGSSIFVMPNKVDLSQTAELFAKVSENYVVVVMLSAFFALYLILLIWAIYADKQAFIKKKMTLLADNHPCAQYYYLLNVQTGHRRGAGTSAQVELVLLGMDGRSTRRHLTDPQKPVFERGGVDFFLLATPFPLGDLESIRIRHDNSGKSPDWYLNKVTIQDMQLRKHWHFLCSSWLSSTKGDGNTKKTFESAKHDEIMSFSNLFQTRTSSGFRDEHIWVSVVDPPRRSPFTRAQRVSCCMCLLLCTMAINIMFWNKPQDEQSPIIFSIGSLDVTWEDIIIGVESGLLMFPINILIISIFRSIKPRLPQSKNSDCTKPQWRVPTIDTFYKDTEELVVILSRNNKNQVPPLEKNVETIKDLYGALTKVQDVLQLMQGLGENNEDEHWGHCSHFVLCYLCHMQDILEQIGSGAFSSREDYEWVQNTLGLLRKKAEAMYSTHAPRGLNTAPKEKKKKGCWLPWWFVFVGWFLLLTISGISTFFTLLYGFVYGKESSIQWIISLALSLFQSIFILQPLKVVGVAIFVALILKTVTVEESEEVEFLMKEQQEKCQSFAQMSTHM